MPLTSPLHRIPVLWSLYRPLLRLAPTPILASQIRRLFRRSLLLQNLPKVRQRLLEGHTMLEELTQLSQGNAYLSKQYDLLSTHLSALSPPPSLPALPPPKVRTVVTRGIIKATPYNPPLPRLKPQPEGITMLLVNRRKAIQRRWDRFEVAKSRVEEGAEERRFEARLGVSGIGEGEQWEEEVRGLKVCFGREAKRNMEVPSAKLMRKAQRAHRSQVAMSGSKARLRTREGTT